MYKYHLNYAVARKYLDILDNLSQRYININEISRGSMTRIINIDHFEITAYENYPLRYYPVPSSIFSKIQLCLKLISNLSTLCTATESYFILWT